MGGREEGGGGGGEGGDGRNTVRKKGGKSRKASPRERSSRRREGGGGPLVITKRDKALDALDFYLELNERNMHPERVTQDVLILSGRKDHFIPFRMHKMQIQALSNARSVTGRVFTRAEHAENHCQTGNLGLALGVMIEWSREKT